MIHIILFWILLVAKAPIFIWIAFWLHLVVSSFMSFASLIKGYSENVNLEKIGKMKNFEDDQEYYGDWEYTTNSQLGYVKRSPAMYWKMRNGAKIDGAALRFGSLVHTMILEPEKVTSNFVVFNPENRPEQDKGMTSKINKEWKRSLDLSCKDGSKYLMTMEQYELAQKLKRKLYDCPEVKSILDNCETEVPKTWLDFNTMSKCKGKADIVIDGGDMLVDIKTTGKDVKDFKKECLQLRLQSSSSVLP